MTLHFGSPALRKTLDQIEAENAQTDRELDAKESARVLREAFEEQVTKFLRRAVPNESPR